jgi:DNA-binding YbaB/EbfC family protein
MGKGLNKMMKEAQKLEKRLEAVRESLATMEVEGSAGGGAIKVKMNCQRDVISISIDPETLEGGDNEMLEDLLLSALRDAKQKSDETAAREMAKVAGMIPPLGNL